MCILNILPFTKVWKEAPEGECYLADGSRSKISGNDFPLSLRGGEAMTPPWTLSNYMKLLGAAFPSPMWCHGQCSGKWGYPTFFQLFIPEEDETIHSHSDDPTNVMITEGLF